MTGRPPTGVVRSSPKSGKARDEPALGIFEDLVESAFEFLLRAIDELEQSPKFSTIHFATAVELFLKARLMREHWSLVVDHPDKATRADFNSGRARTVTPEKAIGRLRDIADVTINPEAEKAFRSIAERRNRMIHFVHGSGGEGDSREQVAIEQCVGWFHLENLLSDWSEQLGPVARHVRSAQTKMKKHKRFLQVRFDRAADQIREAKAEGIDFCTCRSCGFPAAAVMPVTEAVARLVCLVCDVHDVRFTIACPDADCGAPVQFLGSEGPDQTCQLCETPVGSADIREALDSEIVGPDDYLDFTEKNCALCGTLHSVVQHAHVYVCVECLAVEDDIAQCGFCNEQQIGGGDLEFSYRTGCEFCDGANGWEGDD